MKNIKTIFAILFVATTAVALNLPPTDKESQYILYPNELINGGAENGTAQWSATGGTLTATTVSENVRLGSRAISWEPTAAAQTLSTNSWIVPGGGIGNGMAKMFFKTSATDDIFSVMSGATTLSSTTIVSNGEFSEHTLNFVATAGSTISSTVVSQSNSDALYVDSGYLGYATNIFQTYNNSGWIDGGTMQIGATTTAPTKGNATIVVDKTWYKINGPNMDVRIEYRHSAAGTATAGTGDYLWSIPTGYTIDTTKTTVYSTLEGWGSSFQNNNNVGTCQGGNGANQVFGTVSVYDSTRVRCFAEDGASNAQGAIGSGGQPLTGSAQYYLLEFSVPIQGLQPQSAVSADQADYGWRAYTPTFTGFGTVSASTCFHARSSEDLLVRCRFTPGTTTGVEARVSLPNSLTASSTIATLESVGFMARNAANASAYSVNIEPSVGYVTFGKDNSGGALSKELGNAVAASGDNLSFFARIPIQGWTTNQRAPSLMGSITSKSNFGLKLESALVSSAGTVTENGSADWISGNCSIASSRYNCSFTEPFVSTPNCWAQTRDNSDSNNTYNMRTISTTAVEIDQKSASAGGSVTDRAFTLYCFGVK